MNRGSCGHPFAALKHIEGFNEAPIHESGKCPYVRAVKCERCRLQ